MKIAYLMNQHPYPSCTFIRREILELEMLGISLTRFSLRYPSLEIKDEADQEEIAKTYYILREGAIKLLFSVLWALVISPLNFFKALRLCIVIGNKSERGLLINLIYLVEACALLRQLRSLDIVHLHTHFASNAATVAMLCHTLGGPPYSFTVHGPDDFDQPKALALTEKIEKSAFVVGISSFTKSQLLRWCGYSHWAKIHIVHCGVDNLFLEQSFVPLREESNFVCVGRFSEQKGHLILVEAAKILAETGLTFKIVLAGDGPLRQEIETRISENNLQKFFEITGWLTNAEVRQQILNAQILVLPSFAEGLPVVIMESLALYRPVIATYIAGIPELIEPHQCGWLVPSGSVTALADTMKLAIQTPREQLTEMGKNGCARIHEDYNVSRETQKLLNLFHLHIAQKN